MKSPRAGHFLGMLTAALCLSTSGLFADTEGLSGTSWRLLRFQGGDGQILAADEGSSYTVEFRKDDTVAVQVDCHRGRGTWVSRSASQLELGPLALTRATCPQASLHAQITKQWPAIRSYVLRDGHLFLSMGAGAGTYEFEPVNSSGAAPTATASTATVSAGAATPAATTPDGITTAAPTTSAGITTPAATASAGTTRLAAAAPAVGSSWLDESKPVSWNMPGAAIPQAPREAGTVDPRCRALARAPELEVDKRLTNRGWDLIGAYQGGWGVLVLEGAASYDGMCRPQTYQEFVFIRGAFAGTLSPRTMDSRSEGSLNRVTLQGDGRLVAEYARYARSDALCCASRTTSVVFAIAPDQAVVRPQSASTFPNR